MGGTVCSDQLLLDLRYNAGMGRIGFMALALGCLLLLGCKKDSTPEASTAAPASAAQGGGGGTVVSPDVGPVTPVTNVSIDDAAGGGVNSAAMKKAKGVAAGGVSSVNSAEKQGYGSGDDGN